MPKTRNYKTKRRKKAKSWRKLQLSAHLKRRLKILGLALMVVISTALVYAAVNLYRFFTQPLVQAAGAVGQSVSWDGGRFNLLLVVLEDAKDETSLIRRLDILSLDSRQNTYQLVRLPVEAEVAAGDFGVHPLKTVYALGALSKPKANLSLTAKTVSRLLAVPVDGYILTDESGLGHLEEVLGRESLLTLLPNLAVEARRQLKTDLTFSSLATVGRFLWGARSSGETLEVPTDELFEVAKLDRLLSEKLRDDVIVEERLKVQILNATGKPGLAGHIARYITNLGGNVINLDNFEDELVGSVVVTKKSDSHTVRRLVEVLQIEEVREEFAGVGERADVVIICGLDSWYNL